MQNINSRSKTKLIPIHNPAVKVEPSNLHNTTLHTVTPPPPLLAINTLSARGRIRFKQNNTVLQNRCLGKGGGDSLRISQTYCLQKRYVFTKTPSLFYGEGCRLNRRHTECSKVADPNLTGSKLFSQIRSLVSMVCTKNYP